MSDLAPLLLGMQLTDSALPTGAFSHSFGFETYLNDGTIHDADSFAAWLEMFCTQQLTFTDALAIRLVYAATSFADIAELDRLVTAAALPAQVRRAGTTMGKRLLTIASPYPEGYGEAYAAAVESGDLAGHPATVWGVIAHDVGIGVEQAVAQHVYATLISLTQNAVRGIPLGQNAGQRIVRRAQEWVERAVVRSRTLTADDLGAAAPGLEIAQMNHERQRARLFMS